MLARIQPAARPLEVVGVITDPVAAWHDSHLGGFAAGRRFIYLDGSHFVWWYPERPPITGYGSGDYGEGSYGLPVARGFGRSGYGAGAYGKTED